MVYRLHVTGQMNMSGLCYLLHGDVSDIRHLAVSPKGEKRPVPVIRETDGNSCFRIWPHLQKRNVHACLFHIASQILAVQIVSHAPQEYRVHAKPGQSQRKERGPASRRRLHHRHFPFFSRRRQPVYTRRQQINIDIAKDKNIPLFHPLVLSFLQNLTRLFDCESSPWQGPLSQKNRRTKPYSSNTSGFCAAVKINPFLRPGTFRLALYGSDHGTLREVLLDKRIYAQDGNRGDHHRCHLQGIGGHASGAGDGLSHAGDLLLAHSFVQHLLQHRLYGPLLGIHHVESS